MTKQRSNLDLLTQCQYFEIVLFYFYNEESTAVVWKKCLNPNPKHLNLNVYESKWFRSDLNDSLVLSCAAELDL